MAHVLGNLRYRYYQGCCENVAKLVATNASGSSAHSSARDRAFNSELRLQADMLRCIVGNPFRPVPDSLSPTTTVVELAQSVSAGTECGFALHDALLESGRADLAGHFAREQWHPKGCWAVDLILGKK
jgi:hypothetical protein